MTTSGTKVFSPRQVAGLTWLVVAIWMLAVGASATWGVRLLHDSMLEAAVHDARNSFNKDVLYRKWAASHGGVYVPATAATPPNPHLADVAERDLVTPSGRQLTLVNPAYMTRQIHELEAKASGTQGHITSLKPLRPENAPDAWEAAALRAIERGKDEVFSRETLRGEPYLRLMRPLATELSCLKCHASQGYREGDVRGGMAIAVPLAPYLALASDRSWHIVVRHGALWAMGALAILLAGRNLRRRLDRQLESEEALRASEAQLVEAQGLANMGSYVLDVSLGIWKGTEALERVFGIDQAYPRSIDGWTALIHPADRDKVGETVGRMARGELQTFDSDYRIIRHDDRCERWVHAVGKVEFDAAGRPQSLHGTIQDITPRKEAEAERERLLRELQDALANVKSLSGMLPICATCKKIRDDKGYWSQVESYVMKHTDAKFTHGICPECIAKYYPDAG